jgi:hypothetical protein
LSAPELTVYGGPTTLSIGARLLREADPVFAPAALTLDAPTRPLTELICVGCGYGASCRTVPDRCPMCQQTDWEYAAWRPFSRSLFDA